MNNTAVPVVRALDVGILLLDPLGEFEFANAAAGEMLGVRDEQCLRNAWHRIRSAVEANHGRLPELASNPRMDLTVPVPGGEKRFAVAVHRLATADCVGFLVTLRDLHLAGMLERDVRLAARYRNLRRIQGIAAHELRGAINVMTLNAQVLRQLLAKVPSSDPEVLDKSKKYAASIVDSAARLGRLAEDIFGKDDEPRDSKEGLDLGACIETCVARIAPFCSQRRITVDLELPDEPSTITGNRELLEQALMNLTLNAIDGMPKGGGLTIGASNGDGMVHIHISDQGPGIPAERLDSIWNLHFTSRELGAGIGLHAALLAVQAHGGSVRAWNRPECGATFEILLPLTPPKP